MKKTIDPLVKKEVERLEKDFNKEYGEDPTYQEHSVGESIYSVEISNSKNPIPSYRSSVESAKLVALKKAIEDMKDE